MNCICIIQEVKWEVVSEAAPFVRPVGTVGKTRQIIGHADLWLELYIRSAILDRFCTNSAFNCAMIHISTMYLRIYLLGHQELDTGVRMDFILPNQLSQVGCLTEAPVLSIANIEKINSLNNSSFSHLIKHLL